MLDSFFPPSASTYSGDVDGLILLVTVLVGFWFLAAQGIFFWLLWRFRARDGHKAGYYTGDEPALKRWITIPHALIIVCDLFIIYGAVRVWYDVKLQQPEADETVRIEAQQWAWVFTHPGPDGQLDTADDISKVNELHVQADKVYHFELSSRDVLHSFSVPVFRLKQDAIPGRVIKGWFQPTTPGRYDIQCTEICGIGHALMPANLYVESPAAHASWLTEHAPSVASR